MSAAPAAVETRSFYHPIQRDRATFLETSEESGGERTLVELEVAPGGGNVLHRHNSFSERFEVLEGELTVHVDGQDVKLQPGEVATAPIGSLHHFANRTDAPVTALIELRPGSRAASAPSRSPTALRRKASPPRTADRRTWWRSGSWSRWPTRR